MAGKNNGDQERALALLRNSRTGKKGSVTKRIKRIEKHINDKGSRRLIERLVTDLKKVFLELEQVCAEISCISEIDENNCIESYRADLEECEAIVFDYFESRKEDPPSSSGSVTSSWLRKHAEYMENPSETAEGSILEETLCESSGLNGINGEEMNRGSHEIDGVTEKFDNMSLRCSPGNKVASSLIPTEPGEYETCFSLSTSPNPEISLAPVLPRNQTRLSVTEIFIIILSLNC